MTAGATTAYDQARALQDWFRAEFEYSLEVPAGHGSSAIEAFLQRRAGYCEQFAGTMAAMARAVGLPARVAVGFTPGCGRRGRRLPGDRATGPRLARDLVRRVRLGSVRTDPRPGRTGDGEHHRGRRRNRTPRLRPGRAAGHRGAARPGRDHHARRSTLRPTPTPAPPHPRPTRIRPPCRGRSRAVAVAAARRRCRSVPSWPPRPWPGGCAVATSPPIRSSTWSTCGRGPGGRSSRPQGNDSIPPTPRWNRPRTRPRRLPVAAGPMRSLAEVATAARYGPPGTVDRRRRRRGARRAGPLVRGDRGGRRLTR